MNKTEGMIRGSYMISIHASDLAVRMSETSDQNQADQKDIILKLQTSESGVQITDLLKNAELSNTEWFKVFDKWNGDNIALATGGVDASIGVAKLTD